MFTTKRRPSRRAFRPSLEGFERRVVLDTASGSLLSQIATGLLMQGLGAGAGFALTHLMTTLGVSTSIGQLQEIRTLVENVSHQIDDLHQDLAVRTSGLALDEVVKGLDLSKLDTATRTYLAMTKAATPEDKDGLRKSFDTQMSDLGLVSSVDQIQNALQGKEYPGAPTLMQYFSDHFKAKSGERFLSHSYSQATRLFYQFIKDKEALALLMVTNYLQNLSSANEGVVEDLTLEVTGSALSDAATVPQLAIPSYATFDTETGYLWGTGLKVGYLDANRALNVFPSVLNGTMGDEASTFAYIRANLGDSPGQGKGNVDVAEADYRLIRDETGFNQFTWRLPTVEELEKLDESDGSITSVEFGAKYLEKKDSLRTSTYKRSAVIAGEVYFLYDLELRKEDGDANLNTDRWNGGPTTALYVATVPGGESACNAQPWQPLHLASQFQYVIGVEEGGTTTLSARLTSMTGEGVANALVTFSVDGEKVGQQLTDGTGLATLDLDKAVITEAGIHADAVGASFEGTNDYQSANQTGDFEVVA